MRIDVQRYTERFGSVRLNDVQRVLELDSGRASGKDSGIDVAMINISDDVSRDIEEKMVIAIMVKDEKLKLFEGVVSGVPHDCLIIVVSNSKRKRVDRFRMERDALFQFSRFTRRKAMIVHQKDPILAQALGDAGYGSLLDEDGLLRSGKSEGMIAAMLLAKMAKKDYIGFVDADNYFPGAIWEYAKVYAAGFSMATSPYAMVRILWRYKPKVSEGMYFRKYGRVSEISNKYMNNLISTATGFETDIIKTSNAGEHAMSLRLAEILPYAAGYAVEPQELLSIFEGFGGVMPIAQPTAAKHGVEILQIETRNPHLHEEKGGRHLYEEMLLPGLSSIYHSPLCFDTTRESIVKELVGVGVIREGEEPPRPRLYEAPRSIDFHKFQEAMAEHLAGTRQRGVHRVIYTDLDGSLIDHHTYSYEVARPLVKKLNAAGIPLVFVSSKTRAEQEVYRRGLDVTGPFIAENGGAIFIPRGYFSFPYDYQREVGGYRVIELARPYAEIRQKLAAIREKYGLSLRGYGDMDIAEVARITGLDTAQAGLAKKREYQETLNLTGSDEEIEIALARITEAGLSYSRGGRFYGVMTGSDKGRAVRMLTGMFMKKLGRVETIGVGDSGNDTPMLAVVDRPVLVQKPGGRWQKVALANLYRVDGIGPQGWVKAVAELTGV